MIELFDIGNVLIEIGTYPISYLEAFSVLTALISVWLAAKNNIHTWTVGLVSVSAFFCLFYQAQLYSDMLLQAFLFATSLLGIISWKRSERNISTITTKNFNRLVLIASSGAIILGLIISSIHLWVPEWFPLAAEFPYLDAFTTTFSVVATILLIKRILECWWFWIAVDVVAIFIYFHRGLYVVSVEYLIFLGMAIYGLHRWKKTLESNGIS
jgi:nicotinamide mononucleotide transporter